MHIRHFFINFICAFVLNKRQRDTLRTKLKINIKPYIKFVYDYVGTRHIKTRYYVGHGCQNFIIVVNNKTCFKFPIYKSDVDTYKKIKIITDYFSTVLPIKIPHIEIIKYNDIYITKYDFIDGVTIDCINKKLVKQNIYKLANQISEFLFAMATCNPNELKPFIPKNCKKPGFLYGWGHGDIGGNFILNQKTMDIIGFIDWDNVFYGNIMPDLACASHHWCKLGYDSLGIEIMKQYTEKYLNYIKNTDK